MHCQSWGLPLLLLLSACAGSERGHGRLVDASADAPTDDSGSVDSECGVLSPWICTEAGGQCLFQDFGSIGCPAGTQFAGVVYDECFSSCEGPSVMWCCEAIVDAGRDGD
jgi:hypothetical protein